MIVAGSIMIFAGAILIRVLSVTSLGTITLLVGIIILAMLIFGNGTHRDLTTLANGKRMAFGIGGCLLCLVAVVITVIIDVVEETYLVGVMSYGLGGAMFAVGLFLIYVGLTGDEPKWD